MPGTWVLLWAWLGRFYSGRGWYVGFYYWPLDGFYSWRGCYLLLLLLRQLVSLLLLLLLQLRLLLPLLPLLLLLLLFLTAVEVCALRLLILSMTNLAEPYLVKAVTRICGRARLALEQGACASETGGGDPSSGSGRSHPQRIWPSRFVG